MLIIKWAISQCVEIYEELKEKPVIEKSSIRCRS